MNFYFYDLWMFHKDLERLEEARKKNKTNSTHYTYMHAEVIFRSIIKTQLIVLVYTTKTSRPKSLS